MDGLASSASTMEHPSIEEAREEAVRAALALLLNTRSHDKRRVAHCEVTDPSSGDRAHFDVTLELTDYI